MPLITPRRVRLVLIRWGLLIGLLLSLLATGSASAALKGCRGDPKVGLSNGVKLTMAASIAADASQVKMVTYTVHAPKGLTLNKVVYTGGALKDKERVIVLFDSVSGYQIEAQTELIKVVADVTIDAALDNQKRSQTASSTKVISFLFP